MRRIKIPPATFDRLPCSDMPTARPIVPRIVTIDAVLTPSCATIIKSSSAVRMNWAVCTRNVLTPTSILVWDRNFSNTFVAMLISLLPTK